MLLALAQLVLLFGEPEFPVVDAPTTLPKIDASWVDEVRICGSVGELSEELSSHPDALLVWRHGSTFPAGLWNPFLEFIEGGGSFLYLGGEPFTRTVTGPPGTRVVHERSVSLLEELDLNQSYTVEIEGERALRSAVLRYELTATGTPLGLDLPRGARAFALEPRLSQHKVIEEEDGSAGDRDAIVRGLAHIYAAGTDQRFASAAGVLAIDRLQNRFAGGRWTFRPLTEPAHELELRHLIQVACTRPFELTVTPTLGCFHEGEVPTVNVALRRPPSPKRATLPATTLDLDVIVRGPFEREGANEPRHYAFQSRVEADESGSAAVALEGLTQPGLYRVSVVTSGYGQAHTGFWIFDEELFESGGEISFDSWTMRLNGQPEPVVGTTTMSNTVHRDFLARPDAWTWDDTFRDLRDLELNFVRTGVWTAWRNFLDEEGHVSEPFLRALEAYYLSARRHDIPVLFTFFAFVPESFGGESPYFDPVSLAAQKNYLREVVARFANTKEMLWDLINEPSFANPQKLWFCRPNGDAHEAEAFRNWLHERYGESWEDEVRSRWRLRPDESIGVPTEADYAERYIMEAHRPYRAREYSLFAQDAFRTWSSEMVEAIREAGSNASITVGQDEGGLNDRPSPLLHHDELDYTSIHTWWYSDALGWDGAMAKVRGKPLLVSETGVMQRALLSGTSIRTPESSARLLSRKIAHAFASGAFGAINWAFEINPYMASDNEVSIGVRRADGSYKPELDVLRRSAGFFARNKTNLTAPPEPEVALILVASDHFSPRDMQTKGTRRALEILTRDLGVRVQVVHEHRISELGRPKWIVLPACRGISDTAWTEIEAAIADGSHLSCSGWFENDDAGRSAVRLGLERRRLAQYEEPGPLHYPLDITESGFAANSSLDGSASISHSPIPIEWADRSERQVEFYRTVASDLGLLPEERPRPGVLRHRLGTTRGVIEVVINERSEALTLRGGVVIPANEGHVLYWDDRGTLLDSTLPE